MVKRTIECDINSVDLSDLVKSLQPQFPHRDMSCEDICGCIVAYTTNLSQVIYGFFKDNGNLFMSVETKEVQFAFENDKAESFSQGMKQFFTIAKNKKTECIQSKIGEDSNYLYLLAFNVDVEAPENTGFWKSRVNKEPVEREDGEIVHEQEYVVALMGDNLGPAVPKMLYFLDCWDHYKRNQDG